MIDRRLALLLAAAIGLGGYAVWSGDSLFSTWLTQDNDIVTAVKQLPAAPVAEIKSDKLVSLNPLAALTTVQFEDIVKRPLFNPTRAPAPVAEPPPVEEPPPEAVEVAPPPEEPVNPNDFALLGIASKNGIWTVVMRWNPSNEIHRLKTGGEIQGWSLTEITPQKVKLSRNGQDIDIKMFQNLAPPPGQSLQALDPSQADGQGQSMNPQRMQQNQLQDE